LLFLLSAATFGCRRGEGTDGTPLYAPFNRRKPIAVVSGRVENGRCEVAVRSMMEGRLALRADEISLRSPTGAKTPVDPDLRECILGGGRRTRLVDRPIGGLKVSVDYQVEVVASAVPLDEPGRTMYREWAWIRRPTDVAAIDAELAQLEDLPQCPED
jgi:hypothetical protein